MEFVEATEVKTVEFAPAVVAPAVVETPKPKPEPKTKPQPKADEFDNDNNLEF
jgi:hypothetical protein